MENTKDAALEKYYTALSRIPPPDGTNYGMVKYSKAINHIVEQLYDDGYTNGYQDALNTDFEFKKQ